MPDTKLTQLPVMTTPTTDDVMYIVDSPGGAPASMQLSAASLSKYLGPYFNVRDYGAVADSFFTDGTVKGNFTVSNVTTGSAPVVTVTVTHNYEVGDYVAFLNTTTTPALSSTSPYQITAITGTTFTITGITITVGGATSGTARNHTCRSASANFVAGDVGLVWTGLRTGFSTNQANTSLVLAVVSSSQITLTNTSGRTQSSVMFYLNRGGDQTAAIQSAIDAASAAGGGVVYLSGVGYLISAPLVLKTRVWLEGAGQGATTLRLAPASNCTMIRNDYTTNANACLGGMRHIRLLGARTRQSDFTTTLNGAYTAGGTTMVLSAPPPYPFGTAKIGSTWFRFYQATVGSTTINILSNGCENTSDASQGNGATVTIPQAHGIFLYRDPYNTNGSVEEMYDLHYRFEDIFVYDIHGDGFLQWGQAVSLMDNSGFEYCDNVSVRPSYDSHFSNMNVGNSGRWGWVLHGAQTHLTNITTYFSGGNTGSEGYGYLIEGPVIIEEGLKILTNCTAQDNKGGGFMIRNAERTTLAACMASSNSTSGSGLYPAVLVDGSKDFNIDVACVERQAVATQLHAIKFLETGGIINDKGFVRITHGNANGAGAILSAVDTSTITGAVEISVNGTGGIVSPAFSTPYTPDPYGGNIINLGVLTSALTINAPSSSHLGCELEFRLKQDGTGGRAVTWNAIFVFNPAYANTGNTLNQVYRARFRFDGTNWNLMWQSQSATAGTYWC